MPLSKGRGKEIGHRRMAFDYREARATASRYKVDVPYTQPGEALITLAVTLTPVEEGKLGYVGEDGYGRLADKDSHEAEFVYMQGGNNDEQVPISMSGYVDTDVSLVTGAYVFLGTQGLPTCSVQTTGIYQCVGKAITKNRYLINIDEGFIL